MTQTSRRTQCLSLLQDHGRPAHAGWSCFFVLHVGVRVVPFATRSRPALVAPV